MNQINFTVAMLLPGHRLQIKLLYFIAKYNNLLNEI